MNGIRSPHPPEWRVDWDALDAEFEWVRALRDVPQDPVHHAEGDVWIHTRMVLEALGEIAAWRALDPAERDLVFAASLLHDVAKPRCTKTEPDGRVTSRGHSIRGAVLARRLLWRMGVPFAHREAICALIRHHQAPFFLIERADAARAARAISQSARCDHLSLVAEADARGRRCADPQRLLDNTALFRELCAETGCLTGPAPFPSAHARLLYLRGDTSDVLYHPHESFRADVVVMSGLPGAGKDSWVRENLGDWPVVSLDQIRDELDVDPGDAQGEVVAHARELARTHLRAGRSFVWNATNLSRQLRTTVVNLFLDYGARVRIVYVEVSEETLHGQNRARAAAVPGAVIARLLERWEVPEAGEAHEVSYVVDRAPP
jgi:putative nucleotidyltransferase with HDIG domain